MVSDHLIDLPLWEKADFEGVSLLLGEGMSHIPAVVLVFRSDEYSVAIFDDWRERFGEIYAECKLLVTFVRGGFRGRSSDYVLSIAPSGYVSTAPPSDLAFLASSSLLPQFQRRVRETKQYALLPATLRDSSDAVLHWGHHLHLRKPKFRNASSIPDDHRLAKARDLLRLDPPTAE